MVFYFINLLFKPSYAGSDVVRIFKSITARELFKRFPELRKELWGGELWSDEYYFATIGEKAGLEQVKKIAITFTVIAIYIATF